MVGYVFLDHLSWDNFNESEDLNTQIERFRTRTGHYSASVHADQIYRTRDHLRWCKRHGIRLSGPPLGRPSLDDTQQALLRQQTRDNESMRVAVEGKFGQAKRRFSLGRVMAKLAQTAETMIAITCLVMNLEKRLRRFIVLFLMMLIRLLRAYQADVCPFAATLSDDWLKTLDHQPGNIDHVWAAG